MSSVVNRDFDDILKKIAEALHKNEDIDKLGKALGFGTGDIGRKINENSKQGGNYMGTLDLLRTWRNKQTPSTEDAALRKALFKVGFDNLAAQYLSTPVTGDDSTLLPSSTVTHEESSNRTDPNVTEKQLLKLAGCLPADSYTDVAIHLGVSYTEHENIRLQNQSSLKDANFKMLMKWKCREDGGKVRDLDIALNKTDCGRIVYKGDDSTSLPSSTVTPVESLNRMDRMVTDGELDKLAGCLLAEYFTPVAIKLGVGYAEFRNIRRQNAASLRDANFEMLMNWRHKKDGGKVRDLDKALDEADCGGLSYKGDTDEYEGNDDGGLLAPPEILARGPRAQRAYAEAAKAGKKKVFRTRLMLVGQERVGKTSLKKTLTRQGFDKNEAITDGVETTDACDISIEVVKVGEKMWSIHKKGHENEFKEEDVYKTAMADEIAKRLTATPPQDRESLELNSGTTLARGLNPSEAEEVVMDNVEVPKAKDDDANIPNHIASRVEKKLKEEAHLKETGTDITNSVRGEGVSLRIWDFAGQDIYYSIHQVFLTWRAIYVIVFDLSRSLDSVVPPECRDKNYEMVKGGAKSELTCLEFINFWLYSIYTHAVAPSSVINKNTRSKTAQKSPPIFIVGTHRESVKGDAEEKKKKIGSAFEKIRKSIRKSPFECHVVPTYYAIENSLEDEDEKLVALRRQIEKVAMEEPYMGEEIPLRWLLFEEALAADKSNYMSLDQTKELTQSVDMESEHELPTMLTFYHDLGYVVYYGGIEDQQSLLRDMVILNPQWLIDVFKQVITILDHGKRDGIVSDAWTTLEEDGILEDRLIQHMWQGFLEQKEALVQLMANFDLICEAPVERLQQEQHDGVDTEVSNETEKMVKKRYYVPSRMTSHCPPEEIAQIKSSTDFYVDFHHFLPDGLFHRLMSRAVRWTRERDGEPVNLFHRHISLMVDGMHQALIEMLPPCEATIKVIVYQGAVAGSDHDGESHKPPVPSAVKEVMDFVTESLNSLIQHWARRIKYDVLFLCPRCSRKNRIEDCSKRMSLKCGLHNIPTAAIKLKFGMSEEGVESRKESPTNKITAFPSSPNTSTSTTTPTSAAAATTTTCTTREGLLPSTRDFDDMLVTVAKRVYKDLEIDTLGLKLGFTPGDTHRYIATNNTTQNVTYVGTLQMLRDWRDGQRNSTERGALKTALELSGQIRLADDLFPSS